MLRGTPSQRIGTGRLHDRRHERGYTLSYQKRLREVSATLAARACGLGIALLIPTAVMSILLINQNLCAGFYGGIRGAVAVTGLLSALNSLFAMFVLRKTVWAGLRRPPGSRLR